MAIERTRSLRKFTGGRLHPNRKSRQHARVNKPILTKIGVVKVKTVRCAGANSKQKILTTNVISVADTKKGTVVKTEIEGVVENTANNNYVRRDIFNKGAVVKTKLGNVKITSRPGQHASLTGVLIA